VTLGTAVEPRTTSDMTPPSTLTLVTDALVSSMTRDMATGLGLATADTLTLAVDRCISEQSTAVV
jgi:hypothetical protein